MNKKGFSRSELAGLSDFSAALKLQSERREQDRLELNAKLGEPAVFVPDPEANDSRFGMGYWKGEGGVFAYRRMANGYDMHSRIEYRDDLIDLLIRVRGS